jgi:hypothetical protein
VSVLYRNPDSDAVKLVEKPLEVTVVTDGGPWAHHNMPCPVCQNNQAVLNMNTGVFGPCRDCEKKGWEIRKRSSFKQWFNNLLKERPIWSQETLKLMEKNQRLSKELKEYLGKIRKP